VVADAGLSRASNPANLRPMASAEDWKTLFISAKGRLARNPFVAAFAALLIVWGVYEAIAGGTLRLITGWVVYPSLIYLASCLLSKRLHDRGKSGWYAALIIVAIIAMYPAPQGVVDFLFAVVIVWAAVELAVLGGEEGANRFGVNPLGAGG
jgi:uncharacterized membrane protein YhaH (DUF805 family)